MTAPTKLDHWLFQHINSQWTNASFDRFFPFVTDAFSSPWTFLVIGLLLAYWLWSERWIAVRWLIVLALSLSAADLVAYRLIKPLASRERPEAAGMHPVLRVPSHSGLSFPSNHATNTFQTKTGHAGQFMVWK